jgi:diguanylate cyclase (GGDEF)-like protein
LQEFFPFAVLRGKEGAPVKNQNLRILLAGDFSGEAATSLRVLFPADQKRLDLTLVSSVSALIPTIQAVNPEVIFLDLALARPEPLEVVRRVHRAAPNVPLIVFADAAEKDYGAQSLKEGALDYLFKGFMDPHTMDRVLRAALEHNTLGGLTDLLRDSATGLHTRDGFLTLGAHAMEIANRKRSTLILLCVRIENLESLRAEQGSSAVANALRAVATLLKENFRRTDFIARIGESQFAALAVDTAEPSGMALRQRLDRPIAALNGGNLSGGPLQLRISVGLWKPQEPQAFCDFLDTVEAGLRTARSFREKRPRSAIPHPDGDAAGANRGIQGAWTTGFLRESSDSGAPFKLGLYRTGTGDSN